MHKTFCMNPACPGGYTDAMDLFNESEQSAIDAHAPLAARMRPRTLDEILGQGHFLGPGKMLRRMLEAGSMTSLVFYGPPGVGKTTLASVIARHGDCEFHSLNAASASVKDVRAIIDRARATLASQSRRTVLFIDELHRFNRAQQDVLLGDVERGIVILIGATTENPYFALNSPLLSRSTIFRFEALGQDDIAALLRRAVADPERGFGRLDVTVTDEALDHLATRSDGDARRALGALEVAVLSQLAEHGGDSSEGEPGAAAESAESPAITVDLAVAEESIQQKQIVYDGTGDEHYDAASALIKSMRGSDPDAAIYWMARMLESGEDPRFIARRIVICAAEDVGNADPMALVVAASALQVSEFVGLPECQLPLAQAAVYIACAPKSNACTMAIGAARDDVRSGRTLPVPVHLRDSHYRGAKSFGHGQGYQCAHNAPGGVAEQDYLGVERTYYEPTDRGYEKKIAARLEEIRRVLRRARKGGDQMRDEENQAT